MKSGRNASIESLKKNSRCPSYAVGRRSVPQSVENGIFERSLRPWEWVLNIVHKHTITCAKNTLCNLQGLVTNFVQQVDGYIPFNGAETNCRIAQILGILQMNSYCIQIFSKATVYYNMSPLTYYEISL